MKVFFFRMAQILTPTKAYIVTRLDDVKVSYQPLEISTQIQKDQWLVGIYPETLKNKTKDSLGPGPKITAKTKINLELLSYLYLSLTFQQTKVQRV